MPRDMTDERPKAAKAVAAAQNPDAENPVEEVKYERDQLITAAASLLNSNPAIVAGALAAQPNRKNFTLAEGVDLVREHTTREIPNDGEVT